MKQNTIENQSNTPITITSLLSPAITNHYIIIKALFIISIVLLSFGSTIAQEENSEFNRDGRWLVETGYNIVSGITGGGTGFSLLLDEDGNTLSSIGMEIGKFTSKNFALKLKLGILSGNGISINNFMAGGKYYIGGVVPIDLGVGVLSGAGESTPQASLSVGYAIHLAQNITLEPSLGTRVTEDGGVITFRLGFAMFL